MSDNSDNAQKRVSRWSLFERVLVTTLIVVILMAAGVGAWGVINQNDLKKATKQNECIARLTADILAYVGDAFKAPPAPNNDRTQAVDGIINSAAKLHSIDKYCPN